MNRLEIIPSDSILIVAPHADDESIGCGGLLSLYGAQCDVWLLTDGSRCGKLDDVSRNEIINIRNAEFEKVMNAVYVNEYRMFGMEDRTLACNLLALCGESVAKYTKVFIPSPTEEHIDHVATFHIVMNILRAAGNNQAPEVFLYGITRPLNRCNCYIDITDAISKKEHLINMYESQIDNIDYMTMSTALNRFWGCLIQSERRVEESYAEVFYRTDIFASDNLEDDKSLFIRSELEKYKVFSDILTRWLKLESTGYTLAMMLGNMNFCDIAVYGYGILGNCLVEILDKCNINVKYVIDKKTDIASKVWIINPESDLPNVDAVVVTAVFEYNKIKDMLSQKKGFSHVKILNLRDLLEEKL